MAKPSKTRTHTLPPSLSHFVIFNPSLKPSPSFSVPPASENPDQSRSAEQPERDKDHEDDLREAAQIIFYTSRSSSSVSRDTMLKQTGLVKGLMGFTDMLLPKAMATTSSSDTAKGDQEGQPLSIRSSKGRLLVHSPEKGFYICVGITLALGVNDDGTQEVLPSGQGLSDWTLVNGLQKGYEDFRLLHGPLAGLVPPTKSTSALMDKFWTRFAFSYENDLISAAPSLDLSLPTAQIPAQTTAEAVKRALEVFLEDAELENVDVGVVAHSGPLHTTCHDSALLRYLASLTSPIEVKTDHRHALGLGHGLRPANRDGTQRDRKTSWGMNMGLSMGWVPTLPGLTPRSITPVGRDDARSIRSGMSGEDAGDADSIRIGLAGAGVTSKAKETKGKWGFGMPSLGLGEAMGSVGTVFGLGGTSTANATEGTVKVPKKHVARSSLSSLTEGLGGVGAGKGDQASGAKVEHAAVGEIQGDSSAAMNEPRSDELASAVALTDHDTLDTATTVSRPELGDRLESSLATEIDTLHLQPEPQPPTPVIAQSVDVEDLQAAVEPEKEIDLGWERKSVYVRTQTGAKECVKRRLCWIIRDNTLFYLLHPEQSNTDGILPADPSSRAVLSLYSKLTSILAPGSDAKEPKETKETRSRSEANSTILVRSRGLDKSGPEMDSASRASLAEVADTLTANEQLREVYARTPAGRFIIGKRVNPIPTMLIDDDGKSDANGALSALANVEKAGDVDRLYMLVGRKDASLTDAENAMRSYLRARPDVTA